jgi:hypothetical protein
MFSLAIQLDKLTAMPKFPQRLGENPPRQGFFEHAEYLKVRGICPRLIETFSISRTTRGGGGAKSPS